MSINTYDGLKREIRAPVPPFHNVPVKLETENHAIIVVEQIEWLYQNGNSKANLKFEDCLSWKELSRLANGCLKICLPVIAHSLYDEKSNWPKCHLGLDHQCMVNTIFLNPVSK